MSNPGNDINFTRCECVGTASAHEFARAAVLDGLTGGEEIRTAIESRADTGWGWLAWSAVVSFLSGVMTWCQFSFSGIKLSAGSSAFVC